MLLSRIIYICDAGDNVLLGIVENMPVRFTPHQIGDVDTL